MDENKSSGGGFGDLIALFAIFALFGGGGMFGGNRGGSGITAADVVNQNNFDTLDLQLAGMKDQMAINAANAAACCCQTQTSILDAKYANALIAKDAELAAANCCCETNRNIDSVKTQMAADTCAIITSQTTLAKDAELREVYNRLNQAERLASEQRIISAVCQSLQPPRPVPAYAAASPYSTFTPTVNCASGVATQCAAVF